MPAHDASALIDALGEPMRSLAARGELRQFRPGALILVEGESGDALYILLAGRVRAFSSDPSEREITFGIDGAGRCFGEMALDGGPRSASVEAVEATLCSMVTRVTVLRHLAEHPDLAIDLLLRVIGRAREATERARRLALMDVYGRLANLLNELADAPDASGQRRTREALTHQALASRIGASREMVSRLLKDLERGGYVETAATRHIQLLKPLPARW